MRSAVLGPVDASQATMSRLRRAALGEAATVVRELETYLVVALRDGLFGTHEPPSAQLLTALRAGRSAGTPTRHDHSGHPVEREVMVAGFPYVVVYRLIDDDLEILSLHHGHHRPVYWTDRTTE